MEFAHTLKEITEDIGQLVGRLIAGYYPFALWKNPQSEEAYLMIDLCVFHPKEEFSIEDLEECFIINSYLAAHPPKPDVISGDIVISIDKQKTIVKYSPKLSGESIEKFIDFISTSRKKQYDQNPEDKGTKENYIEKVGKAVNAIQNGLMQKVVLARSKTVSIPSDLNTYSLFNSLADKYPSAFCYLISSEKSGVWMGATPERLLNILDHSTFITDSIAGTQPLKNESSLADIAWTQKEIEEQAMVSRYIIDCLKKIRLREYDEIGRKTIQAGNLAHLKTSFTIDMKATNSPMLGSTMLQLLHPTSAVCGFPRETANEFIDQHEGFDRKLFSGFLGPVNFQSQTRLFVNLRCMELFSDSARLYAGAGITADSVPKKEFEETEHKMNTLLSVLQSK